MQSKRIDDRVANRFFSDASPSTLLVDTRASQSLEPIRLPAKLRDRIERAQRRAAAAKDGVSIFATDAKNSAVPGPGEANRRSSTASAAIMLGDTGERPRASTTTGSLGLTVAGDKTHLPDVVLSHKMRDFEARANTAGIATLLPAEPADRTLQKLPLEDRERVMLAMQTKIRQIASDVEANFARITKALNANGIFDTTANIQRAQTLCLVDLQRRCKLNRLRDEAMREVLQLSSSTLKKRPSQSVVGKPSHKLSQLLKPPTHAMLDESVASSEPKPALSTRRKQKPVQTPKLPALRPANGHSNNKKDQNLQSSTSSAQQRDANIPGNESLSVGRMLSRRGGLVSSTTASQLAQRDENTIAGNTSANEGDIYARHPHVAQILQLLAAGDAPNNKISSSSSNSAEADMELARVLDPADEWAQRSASYQAVGARAAEALRHRGERQRWDSLGHFGSNDGCFGLACISLTLRQRLEDQQASWTNSNETSRSDGSNDVNGTHDVERDSSNQQQRDKEAYTELQTRILERLRANERRTRTAAAAVRAVGTPGRTRQSHVPQTAPSKTMTMSNSTVYLPTAGSFPPRGTQSPHQSVLGMSASEPALAVATPMGMLVDADLGMDSPSPLRRSLLGTRGRMSMLEQKLLVDSSQSPSKHSRRKESLIGAPRAQLDSKAIGRHSEARIAYRKDSAQTWAWHLPPSNASGSPVDAIPEGDEEHGEAKDRFDEEGNEQFDEEDGSEEGEDGEDGTEYGDDDWESIDSGHTSARSSISIASINRRVTNGNRKHGKKRPPTVQRRTSRSTGSTRSMHSGNALSGNALTLHARLEVIWRVLQFPFSHKLAMLERLSTLQDAETFLSALEHWERVTPLVAIRQRMKLAMSSFAERGKLRVNEWLTPSEFALVCALPQHSESSVSESTPETTTQTKPSGCEIETMPAAAFIDWIRNHIDAVTLQTQKLARELKTNTGEELQFQGYPYPQRI